ncbi:Histidine kinase [Pseudonocardia ammonioxydans]|uniref:Histidine kinase n=1 Tax=Pseudonocardia ammonioxydans TaxID=260086 RepID=A0A1I5HQZ0_PSUAM|nr:GAF domain-containing sensor histidine kinase [Pseudonocardia ammonioxydans]SFO50549.1 Histidine kinase [Pseudonocardia ammonioxydans]
MEWQRPTRVGRVELIRMLLALPDVDDVLDLVARTVCETTGFTRSMIIDLDGPSGRVRGRAGHGAPEGSVASVRGLVDDFPLFGQLVSSGETLMVDPQELASLVPPHYVDLFHVRDLVVAEPLRSERLGLLGIVFCDGGGVSGFQPSAADVRALQEMADVAALAFQHALLLNRSAVLQSLRERAQLAADLHDGVTQQIYAACLEVDELRSSPELTPDDAVVLDRLALRLDTASAKLRSAMQQMVRGDTSDDEKDVSGSVIDRIRALIDESCRSGALTGDIEVKGDGPEPDPARADVMVRTVREGLVNVAKHAGATQIEVQVRRGNSWWTVEISDDGAGSATAVRRTLASGGSVFGLRGLNENVARLGGRLWVSDAPRLLGIRLGVAVPVAD